MNFLARTLFTKILEKNLIGKTPCLIGITFRCNYNVEFNKSSYTLASEIPPRVFRPKSFPNEIIHCRNISFSSWGNALRNLTFRKIVNKIFFFKNSNLERRGYLWYSTLQGVQFEQFFTLLKMPDTFVSWFKVVELHVWMLLVRLVQDGSQSRSIRKAVIKAMWEDAQKRAKNLAPKNINYKKNFRLLYTEFSTILFVYDEAFLMDDRALFNVLWYYFFEESCEDPQKIETLISYIRHQLNYLQKVNTKEIEEKNISQNIWTPLHPHVKF